MKKGNRKTSSIQSTRRLSLRQKGTIVCCLLFTVFIVLLRSLFCSIIGSRRDGRIDREVEKSLEDVIRRGQNIIKQYAYNSNSNDSSIHNKSNDNKKIIHSLFHDAKKKDVVIGIGQDLDPKNFAVFSKSLREISDKRSTDVIIFMNKPIDSTNKKIAMKMNINIIEYAIDNLPVKMQKFHPSTMRYVLYYNYFLDDQVRNMYKSVFMIDVRDSYFQLNPFKVIDINDKEDFHVFTGVTTVTIGKCGWNGKWVEECFGNEILKEIGDNNIICSGVSIGSMDAVFNYLIYMNDVITGEKKTSVGKYSKFPICERNGVDQGAHNVLVYKGVIPKIKIWEQINGPISNLQAAQYDLKNNVVYNKIGIKTAVVHQYDRSQILQKYLFKKYVDWINTDDPEGEWKATSSCNRFDAAWDVDLFHGICDLSMRGGATSPASCCRFCLDQEGCKSFTYYNGKCFLKSCSKSDGHQSGKKLKNSVSGQLIE